MFGFLKNKITGSTEGTQDSRDGHTTHQDRSQSHNESRDYYWENKKLTEFCLSNFPTLSQKRFLYYQRKDGNQAPEIDISIFFAERDKYIVNENNEKKVVSSEFSHLPREDLGVDDVMMRVEILEKYNKAIDEILQKSAAKHYDKFQEGIMNLDYFHKTTRKCMDNVQDAKKDLSLMQGDLVKRSVRIIKLFKQKIKKQKAVKFLRRFKEKFGGIYKVINALDNEEFTNAYEIIPIIKNAKEEFESNAETARSFECLKNCEDYLDTKFDKLQAKVRSGIEIIFSEWSEKKFEAYLKYFFVTEQCYPTIPTLLSQIDEILKNSVKIARDKAVSLYIYGTSLIPQMRSRIKQASEAAKQLSRDAYPKFISRVFYETSLVMYNIDLACKYLRDKCDEGAELVLEDKTTYRLGEYYSKLNATILKSRKNIWQMVQKKISKLLLKTQICEFHYPELMAFLKHINAFFEIGQDFSNSSSKIMRECILQILKEYYTSFHDSNITSLKFFISNEKWRRLPLAQYYKDPKLMKLLSNLSDDHAQLAALFGKAQDLPELENMTLEELMKKNSALSSFTFTVKQNPFHIEEKTKVRRAMTSLVSAKEPDASIDDINENDMTVVANGGSHHSIHDKSPEHKQNGVEESEVVVCPASDIIVKSFETYVQLLNLLRMHSFEIFRGLVTTFELYIYAVIVSFVQPKTLNDLLNSVDVDLLQNIKDDDEKIKALETCHDTFLYQKSYKSLKTFVARLIDSFESYKLKLSIQGDQSSSGNMLLNLGERIIATESILFIYNHLKYIQARLPKIIKDPADLQIINEYYDNYGRIIPKLRELIYFHYMPAFFRNNNIFQSIENVKWEVHGKQEFSNIYTDRIVYFVKDLFERVECLAGGGIPKNVQDYIKEGIMKEMFEQLIESYAKVKKINKEGRDIMLADFQLIVKGLSGLITAEVNSNKEKTEKYISSWHMDVEELKNFVLSTRDVYNLRTLNGLLQSHSVIKGYNRQQRKELLKEIEVKYTEFIIENM